MMTISWRYGQWAVFLISAFVLSASLYFEWFGGLQPCPLCLMQRFCVMLILVLGLMVLISIPARGKALLTAQGVVALAGLYFAGRQVWLQSLPTDQLPACMPGMDVLMRYFPWRDIVHTLLFGAADCGEITWQWLGLSMPAWSVLYFAGLLLMIVFTRFILNRSL